ncbi:MAG: succinate dehydrogenase [Gemmatimonadaceae bacterium]
MQRSLPVMDQRGFGETMRRDAWWLPNIFVVAVLSSFIAYATWAAFQNAHYTFGPYLSPFYSPELWGASPHAWFGPKPAWWPAFVPFSPALIILPVPALFRFTCYYYRGAYYKAFWADPPACSVGEPRKTYWGERSFPLVMQNLHRYGLLLSFIFLIFLWHDAWLGLWWDDGVGGTRFGMGVGSLVMIVNCALLSGYTLGCHSMRHIIGGLRDKMWKSPVPKFAYDCSSACNRGHMNWAWFSLFGVALTDVYIRLCSMGILTDLRII